MSAANCLKLETLARTVAIWSSGAATMIFTLGFATDVGLLNSFLDSLNLQVISTKVLVYMLLLTAVFAGYVIAGKRRWELRGSILALASVAALYGWYGLRLELPIGPHLLALAAPGLFHVFALYMHPREKQVEADPVPATAQGELLPSAA